MKQILDNTSRNNWIAFIVRYNHPMNMRRGQWIFEQIPTRLRILIEGTSIDPSNDDKKIQDCLEFVYNNWSDDGASSGFCTPYNASNSVH